ncbi:PIR Superfamily Protein [Plasmodium ovale wallikeri]|uniref:PIR Superfamily Protein n=1 Tax=Plasmodium ovale wallikeri TaxID=864142 RepID=A0A1A9APD6_PLAOA|nr:PIR Superfamily Protein [Plasmodium ovale wallikeri]SBT58091.1 PIR Superfamily Protein [Plasmodium ovale wallikeri]
MELFSERFYQDRERLYTDLHKYNTHCDKLHDYIDIAYGTIQGIWNNLVLDSSQRSYYNKCRPLFDMLKHNDWEKRKELYDYYVNYKTAYQIANNYEDKCKEYYSYIEGKAELYKHFGDICISDNTNCPKIYDKCISYNPDLVLRTINCHSKIVAERAATSEQAAKARALQHSQVKGLGSRSLSSSSELSQENSDIGKKVGQSVLGVAPVLLTASALYRYTPVGSWIRKLGGYNTNNLSNMDGSEMDGFLSNTQVSGNIFFDNTENYISYQPL